MKKIILVAALGVAGIVSAKTSVEKKVIKEKEEWCGTITIMTSCGLPIQDSYCTSWGVKCLMDNANLLDEYFCNPN